MLLQAVVARLDKWEDAAMFLPHLKCRDDEAQMSLALIRPRKIPECAQGLDLEWPQSGSYAQYLLFWNTSLGKRVPAGRLIEYLERGLVEFDDASNFDEFAIAWSARDFPRAGRRTWNRLSAKARKNLLNYEFMGSCQMMEESLAAELLEQFKSSSKRLQNYLGLDRPVSIEDSFYDDSLLSDLIFEDALKAVAHTSRQWEFMAEKLRDEFARDPRVEKLLEAARPEAHVWIRIQRGDWDVLEELNLLPKKSFVRILDSVSEFLPDFFLDSASRHSRESLLEFMSRLTRWGYLKDILPGGKFDIGWRENVLWKVLLDLWPKWHRKLSAAEFDRCISECNIFLKEVFEHPEACSYLLRRIKKRDFKDEVWDLSEGKFVDRLLENFLPQAGPLLRKFFFNCSEHFYLEEDQWDPFWVETKKRCIGILRVIEGHLCVRQARGLVRSLHEFVDPSCCSKFLNLRLRNGKRLGDYVLRWSLEDEALERLLANGGLRWAGRLFRRDPIKHFSEYFKLAGLERILPLAFSRRDIGELVDRTVSEEELLGKLEWVRSHYAKRPTAAIAFETALMVGVQQAPYLHYLAIHRYRESGSVARGRSFENFYREHRMRKRRGGGIRVLRIPEKPLRFLQRKLLDRGFAKISLPDQVQGFRKGSSLVTNAAPHCGKEVVANVDIRDFFPSTSRDAAFRVSLGLADGRISSRAAGFIADLCCQDGVLPTGAPTSPGIANLVLRRVDHALQTACRNRGLDYTRYADDLTFSGGEEAVRMIGFASILLRREGYQVHPRKVNIFRRGRRQMVTGLAVNEKPTLPRAIRRKIRAAVDAAANDRPVSWNGTAASKQVLRGVIAHLAMTRPDEAQAHKRRLETAGYFKAA